MLQKRNEKIHMIATDKKNKSSNEYSIDVEKLTRPLLGYF